MLAALAVVFGFKVSDGVALWALRERAQHLLRLRRVNLSLAEVPPKPRAGEKEEVGGHPGVHRELGLELVTWTLERADGDGFYYKTTRDVFRGPGDILTTLDVLTRGVGVTGVFSDWPATTTYYANCVLAR